MTPTRDPRCTCPHANPTQAGHVDGCPVKPTNVRDMRGRMIARATEDWPIEKKIAMRAMVLAYTEQPYLLQLLDDAHAGFTSLMLRIFETAAVELRDELECIVVTGIAGMNDERACTWLQQRLAEGCSPITKRLEELAAEVVAIEETN